MNTPQRFDNISAECDHIVYLVLGKMQSEVKRFRLNDGEELKIHLVLDKQVTGTKQRSKVIFESEPEGAKILVNGFPIQKKTPVAIRLRNGKSSEIEIDMLGYKDWKKKIKPIPGIDLTIFAKLSK